MSALPTSHLPQRCKQCGIRFPEGEATMQAHMDWHFRRNRKERETEGRGAHRRWLPRGEVSGSLSFLRCRLYPTNQSMLTGDFLGMGQ